LIPYLANSAATTAIGYIISADGLLYLLMYGIIAGACVWYYRRLLGRTARDLFVSGVIPLVGGLINIGIFIYGVGTQTAQVSIVTAVLVILCAVAAIIARTVSKSPYFTQARSVHDAASGPDR
jgi:hypothetical protein